MYIQMEKGKNGFVPILMNTTQVGARVFHICEFAEIMEANGKSYCPVECKEKEERKEAVKGEKKTGTTRMERSRR